MQAASYYRYITVALPLHYPAQAAECKRRVNDAIGAHLRRLRPELAAELRADESLVLLLLEAPGTLPLRYRYVTATLQLLLR